MGSMHVGSLGLAAPKLLEPPECDAKFQCTKGNKKVVRPLITVFLFSPQVVRSLDVGLGKTINQISSIYLPNKLNNLPKKKQNKIHLHSQSSPKAGEN